MGDVAEGLLHTGDVDRAVIGVGIGKSTRSNLARQLSDNSWVLIMLRFVLTDRPTIQFMLSSL